MGVPNKGELLYATLRAPFHNPCPAYAPREVNGRSGAQERQEWALLEISASQSDFCPLPVKVKTPPNPAFCQSAAFYARQRCMNTGVLRAELPTSCDAVLQAVAKADCKRRGGSPALGAVNTGFDGHITVPFAGDRIQPEDEQGEKMSSFPTAGLERGK